MAEPKSAKQRKADAIVARDADTDGGLNGLKGPNGLDQGYMTWEPGQECIYLDGRYSAQILIAIGHHMLAHAKAKRSET